MPPAAAIVEASTNTTVRTRSTRMPARRAASALPPTANTWRPNTVRRVSTSNTTTKPTKMQTASGTPRSSLNTATATIAPDGDDRQPDQVGPQRPERQARGPGPAPVRQRRRRRHDHHHRGQRPPDRVGEERAGEVGDRLVGQVDRAGAPEDVQQRALPGQQAGQRDDERRHPQLGDPDALEQADPRPDGQAGGDGRDGVPALLHVEHRHDGGGQAAHRPDRQVDLAQQQHQHHADRDRPHRRDLQHEVGEVAGGQEVRVGRLEVDPDGRQARGPPAGCPARPG